MSAKSRSVTDAELEVLKLLWEREPQTARDIRERLYPAGTASDHGTVQKLLERLEKKGLVSRDRREFAHQFRADVSRGELVGEQLEALAEKLTDGSLVPLIMHAVDHKKLSARELRDIRKVLERTRPARSEN